MIMSNASAGWIWTVLLCSASPAQAAVEEPLTVVFVSPAADATVAPDISVTIRIAEDGQPFAQTGERQSVMATILKREQTVAQLPLYVDGQQSDRLPGDSEWTAPLRVRLPDGEYSVVVAIERGEEHYERQASFAVSSSQSLPSGLTQQDVAIAQGELDGIEARLDELVAQVETLAARPSPQEGRSGTGASLLGVMVWVLALVTIAALVLATWLWMRRPGLAKGVASASSAGEKWRPLFGALASLQTAIRGIEKDVSTTSQTHQMMMDQWVRVAGEGLTSLQTAVSGIERDLSVTFQTHQAMMDQRVRVAGELVSLSQSLASVDTLTAPAAHALKAHLQDLLAKAGVESWEPATGLPAPPECEQRPDRENRSAPPLTVTAVLAPGFRMHRGDGWIVLVRPVVSVASSAVAERQQ